MRFLTWNLAMLERSAEAPTGWQQFHTENAVREFVLDVEPDIVCWQELPGMVPFVETLDLLPATTKSHSGNLATLVTHELKATEPRIAALDGIGLLATIDVDGGQLTVANVHLQPGRGGADRRFVQLSEIVAASPTKELLIVGDTNTRVEEVDRLRELGFTGEKPPHPTWDSRANRFRHGGAEFSAYFSRWFASPGVVVSDVAVHRTPVEFQSERFHVSDHFALSGEVRLEPAP